MEMINEILFKGKNIETGEWIEGDISQFPNQMVENTLQTLYIITVYTDLEYFGYIDYEIHPKSVCQYINQTDKNDKKIFVNDIVKVCRGRDVEIGVVYYDNRICAYGISYGNNECNLFLDLYMNKDNNNVWVEVIGNRIDNPELLER